MNKLLVVLPPLVEQKAIVEKVEVLLSWCDNLEQKIEINEKVNKQLMGTIIKEYA